VLAARPALANMRAPFSAAEHGSTAPRGPVDGVTVLGERLELRCVASTCRVRAEYRVRAERAVRAELRFVLPDREGIVARAGDQIVAVDVAELRAIHPRTAFDPFARLTPGKLRDLWQATFVVDLEPGEQSITVEYTQPLGVFETEYGYFVRSTFEFQVRYELWPLREWDLADGFALDFRVVVPPQRGLLGWLFTPAPAVRCIGVEDTSVVTESSESDAPEVAQAADIALTRGLESEADTYVATFRADFPGVIECRIADPEVTHIGRELLGS
jgi:hypothetical protein